MICSKNELAPFATTFVYSPENIEQQALGTLFGIIKIDDISESSSYIVNLLTSVIKKEYFSNTRRSAEESLEASLRKANLALAELVRHGSKSWAGKISFACGSLEKNMLHFSCLGNAFIFLIRHSQIAEISKDLEDEKDSETHPLKTFSNISSGKLEQGDKLIFTSGELTEIFSAEELRQNSEHFSYMEFPGFLEISLGANSELAEAIVIDMRDATEIESRTVSAPIIGQEKIKKIDSFVKDIENSQEYEEAAEKEIRSEENNVIESKYETRVEREEMEYRESWLKRFSLFIISSWASGKEILRRFRRKFRFPKTVTETKKRAPASSANIAIQKMRGLFRMLKTRREKIFRRFKNIDYKNKNLFGIGISFSLVIVIFLIIFVANKRVEKNISQNPSEGRPADVSTLASSDINVKSIDSLETVVNLSENPDHLVMLDATLFVPSNKSVLKIDPQAKTSEEIRSNLDSGNFDLITAMPSLESLFILTDDKKVISLTPVNKNFQINAISLPDGSNIQDLKTYLTYLYSLDPTANQIYRYPRAAGGFGDVQNWMKNGSDIRSAKGFAINDDIFVSGVGGMVAYLQGKADSSITFERPIVNLVIDKIYTEPGFSYIYVLDNQNHRVLQYDKQGKITAQYFNDAINSVKDFAVDENNKTIYLLIENQIKKFSLE